MNVSKKALVLVVALTVLCTLTANLAIDYALQTQRELRIKCRVIMIRQTMEGIFTTGQDNTAMDIGEQYARNILGFNNVTNHNATKFISLGNATIAQTLTKLTQEVTTVGGERAEANPTAHNFGGDYIVNYTKEFTFTGDVYFDSTGLHWNPTGDSDNNMYACVAIDAYTWHNAEKCTIIWSVTYNFN